MTSIDPIDAKIRAALTASDPIPARNAEETQRLHRHVRAHMHESPRRVAPKPRRALFVAAAAVLVAVLVGIGLHVDTDNPSHLTAEQALAAQVRTRIVDGIAKINVLRLETIERSTLMGERSQVLRTVAHNRVVADSQGNVLRMWSDAGGVNPAAAPQRYDAQRRVTEQLVGAMQPFTYKGVVTPGRPPHAYFGKNVAPDVAAFGGVSADDLIRVSVFIRDALEHRRGVDIDPHATALGRPAWRVTIPIVLTKEADLRLAESGMPPITAAQERQARIDMGGRNVVLVDKKTGVQLRFQHFNGVGKLVYDIRATDIAVDVAADRQLVTSPLPTRGTVVERRPFDSGYVAMNVLDIASFDAYDLPMVTAAPAGFKRTQVLYRSRTLDPSSGTRKSIPVDPVKAAHQGASARDAVVQVFRRGLQQFVVTTRLVKHSKQIGAPFLDVRGQFDRPELRMPKYRVRSGAYEGMEARWQGADTTNIASYSPVHSFALWGQKGHTYVTVSGDLTRNELFSVVNGLRAN